MVVHWRDLTVRAGLWLELFRMVKEIAAGMLNQVFILEWISTYFGFVKSHRCSLKYSTEY